MSLHNLKVPVVITSSVIFLGLGVAGGTAAMVGFGYHWKPQAPPAGGAMGMGGGAPGGMMGGMPKTGGGGGGGGMMGGMMGGGGGGTPKKMGGGANSKNQLASLVAKLDVLTRKPLEVTLNDEQKKKIREHLQGLDAKEELSEEDAKKRLDTLLDLLKDQRETLEAAGYRWPGQGGGSRLPADAPNPFWDQQNSKHLRELGARLNPAASSSP